jgi:hypothetical protein
MSTEVFDTWIPRYSYLSFFRNRDSSIAYRFYVKLNSLNVVQNVIQKRIMLVIIFVIIVATTVWFVLSRIILSYFF